MDPKKMIFPVQVANNVQRLESGLSEVFRDSRRSQRTPLTPSPAKPFTEEGEQYYRHQLLKLF